VVCIDSAEGRETITHDGEESDKDTVNDVNQVRLLVAYVDPTDKEKNPRQTEQGDEGGVEGNEETQWSSDVLSKTLHATLESRASRVQHVSDVIIQLSLFLGCPSLECRSVRESSVMRVGKTGSDGAASLETWGFFVDCLGHGRFLGLGILSCFTTTFFGDGASCPICLGIVAR
jgi:hypothetical protein